MKIIISLALSLALLMSIYLVNREAKAQGPGAGDSTIVWDVTENPGVFCKVENADVCVLMQNAADCKKLRGEVAESCPASESEK